MAEMIKKTYYRTLKSVNTTSTADVEKVMTMFGDAVLKGLAVRVIVDADPEEHTNVHAVIEQLRALPQCHFC